jgi:hypothetical protein
LYLSQGVDYVGFLNAKLRDLEGWSALANELIQNADDTTDATRIVLDLTDTALVVSNDAQFSDCGSVASARCTWDPVGDGRKCCDYASHSCWMPSACRRKWAPPTHMPC